MNIFTRILKWNEEKKILSLKFNYEKEVSFIIEELLESTGKFDSDSAREKSQEISLEILKNGTGTTEKIVGSFADIIVFSTGAIIKNGYDPEKVVNEILKKIESRTGKIIDGNFIRDINIKTYKENFSNCLLKK